MSKDTFSIEHVRWMLLFRQQNFLGSLKIMSIFRRVTRTFLGQGGFLGIRALRQTFSYNERNKAPQEKISGFFGWKLFKIAFQIRNFTHRWPPAGHLSPILEHYFTVFQKRQGTRPPSLPSSYAPAFVVIIFRGNSIAIYQFVHKVQVARPA